MDSSGVDCTANIVAKTDRAMDHILRVERVYLKVLAAHTAAERRVVELSLASLRKTNRIFPYYWILSVNSRPRPRHGQPLADAMAAYYLVDTDKDGNFIYMGPEPPGTRERYSEDAPVVVCDDFDAAFLRSKSLRMRSERLEEALERSVLRVVRSCFRLEDPRGNRLVCVRTPTREYWYKRRSPSRDLDGYLRVCWGDRGVSTVVDATSCGEALP